MNARRGRWQAVLCLAACPACIEPRAHQDSDQAPAALPGTVALGDPCRTFEACAPIAGEAVGCRCTDRARVPVCVIDLEEGATCSGPGVFAPCRSGTVCASGDAGAQFSCVPLGAIGDRCSLVGCADLSYCDETGHCAAATAGSGERCFALDAWSCKAPNVCDPGTATCRAPTPAGGTCGSIMAGRSVCGALAFCTLSIGERDGTCQQALADGELCWVDEQCLSRICYGAVCGRGFPADVYASCSLGQSG
jgi:hypothetical protein